MVRVVVKIFGPRYFGIDQYDVVTYVFEVGEGASVREVLELLEMRHPALKKRLLNGGKIVAMHDIWVNGRSVDFLDGLDTKLREGDVVQIIPPFGG
ncbi:MAG: MoaD/ThiS family protein [Pyrobaculum sp.]